MQLKRRPHRFISQVSLVALLLSSSPIPVIALGPPLPAAKQVIADTSPESATALCDPDLGEGGAGGQGAPVLNFPNEKGKYDKAVKAFSEERRKKILLANSRLHMTFTRHTNPALPDLTTSVNARTHFFDQTFGENGVVLMVCEAKRELTKHLEAFKLAQQKEEQETGDGVNACAGADQEMRKTYAAAKKSYDTLSDLIRIRLEGGTLHLPQENGKTKSVAFDSLIKAFGDDSAENYNWNFKQLKAKPIPASDADKLKHEFEMLWGKGSVSHSGKKTKIDSNGYFSDVVRQTIEEKRRADEQAKEHSSHEAKMQALEQSCGPLGAQKNDPKSTSTNTNTDLAGPPPPQAASWRGWSPFGRTSSS